MIVMHGDFDESCDMKIIFVEINFLGFCFVSHVKIEIQICFIVGIVGLHQIYLDVYD